MTSSWMSIPRSGRRRRILPLCRQARLRAGVAWSVCRLSRMGFIVPWGVATHCRSTHALPCREVSLALLRLLVSVGSLHYHGVHGYSSSKEAWPIHPLLSRQYYKVTVPQWGFGPAALPSRTVGVGCGTNIDSCAALHARRRAQPSAPSLGRQAKLALDFRKSFCANTHCSVFAVHLCEVTGPRMGSGQHTSHCSTENTQILQDYGSSKDVRSSSIAHKHKTTKVTAQALAQ